MLSVLTRALMLLAGLALWLDVLLPAVTAPAQVDQHTSQMSAGPGTIRPADARWADTHYTLHLRGGRVVTCGVGYAAYGKLADGDTVQVRSTRILRACIRVARIDAGTGEVEPVESDRWWPLYEGLLGALLLASAIGWLSAGIVWGEGIEFTRP